MESVHFQASVNFITRSCFLPWTAGATESTLSSAKKRLEGAVLLLRRRAGTGGRDSFLFTSTHVTWRMRLSQRWLVEDMELLR